MASFERSLSYNTIINDLESEQSDKQGVSMDDVESVEKGVSVGGKRGREDSEEDKEDVEEDNEGFSTVVKRKPKRLHRSSVENNKQMVRDSDTSSTFRVSLSSKQVLPKQFGLAKLLIAEGISNILKVIFKSPYKVNIIFERKEDSEKLLNCPRFNESDFKCQSMNEVNLSYGVVRNIDLDIEEEEIIEQLKCEYQIVSARRLKRLDDKNKWINSAVIRLAFKSSSLPSYVTGYGCRFKIDPYVFPVTQCSGCWKFGHTKMRCPTGKIKCPKCGQNHENCDTKQLVCLNCKGPHMSLDKSCPIFNKEKQIKYIMSENNCTYKIALNLRQQNITSQEHTDVQKLGNTYEKQQTSRDTNNYKQIENDVTTPLERNKNTINNTNDIDKDEANVSREKLRNNQRINNQKISPDLNREEPLFNQESFVSERSINTNKEKKSPSIETLYYKIKEIVFADVTFKEKIYMAVRLIIKEITSFVMATIRDGDLVKKIFDVEDWTNSNG